LAATQQDTGKPAAIRGTVLDLATGKPIAGATISVQGKTATSARDGSYAIEGLPPGSYTLQIDVPSYEAGLVPVDITAGQTASGDVVLGKAGTAAQEVVITASRMPEKLLDAPVTVESVDQAKIATTGGTTLLSSVAGVKGIDFANVGINDQRISARGFTTQFNSRMLGMVDGRITQLPGNGLPQGNLLPTTTLDTRAIEIVVGPASALYGPNAHDGVINIVTKTPWDESGISMEARGGSQQLGDGALRVAGTAGDFGYKLNGQYLRALDFEPDASSPSHYYGTVNHIFEKSLVGEYDVQSIKADATLYLRRNGWLLEGTYGWSDNDGFTITNAGRNQLRSWQVDTENAQLSSRRWYGRVTRTGNDAGDSYGINTLASIVDKMGAVPSDAALEALKQQIKYIDHSQMYDSELQYRDVLRNVLVTTGVQGKYYMPESQGSYLDDKTTPLRASEIGGYLQLERALLGERINLVGAARVDHHSDYDTQISPKAAVVFTPAAAHKIRVGYNRAFKSPTILENHLLLGGGTMLGNASGFVIKDGAGNVLERIDPLRPEEVNAFEVGYKAEIAEKVFVDTVAYYSFYNDFISPLHQVANPADMTMPTFAFKPDGTEIAAGSMAAGKLLTYTNFGQAQVRGLDVGVDYEPSKKIQLSGGGSFIDLATFSSSDSLQKSLPLNSPEYKAKGSVLIQNLGLRNYFARLSGRWNSSYVFRSGYWDSTKLLPGGEVPSRFVMDLAAGYHFGNGVSLTAVVNNVLDDRNIDVLGSPIVGRFGYLQLSYAHPGLTY
jgi:iron complex outermembrane receptor protein